MGLLKSKWGLYGKKNNFWAKYFICGEFGLVGQSYNHLYKSSSYCNVKTWIIKKNYL